MRNTFTPNLAVEGEIAEFRDRSADPGRQTSTETCALLCKAEPRPHGCRILLMTKKDIGSIFRPTESLSWNIQARLLFRRLKHRSSTRLLTQPRLSKKS